MKKSLYILLAHSMVLGTFSGLPLKSAAEATTDTAEPTQSTASDTSSPAYSTDSTVPSTASSVINSDTTLSTSTPSTTESSVTSSQATTSSTTNMPETRASTIADWMPDPVLQQIVAKAIGKTKETLTQEDMPKVTSLYIQNADNAIASLKGLELATNLEFFYMNSNNQITDFSLLTALPKLKQVYLMGSNVTDQNVPNFGAGLTRLNLSGTSVTDSVYDKIIKMTDLESLTFESNMKITTIEPVTALTKLNELRVQFCGITDFKPINHMPALTQLAAFGQNTGRNDPATAINAKNLNYNEEQQTIFVPFSIMPNRMVNFDGYIPPFSTSNSDSQTYFDFNGEQLPSSRLAITDEGITVSGVTQEEFNQLKTFKYNARLNNPAGTYQTPERFTFYAISSGTYLHQFDVQHTIESPGVTVKYVDEAGDPIHPEQKITGNVDKDYDATTEEYQLEIPGYSLDKDQLPSNMIGTLTADPQTVTHVYKRNAVILKAHDSTITVGDEWSAKDNFDGGTDPNGNPITIDDVKAVDDVNNKKVGKYEVTYSYSRVPNRSWSGDQATATATVTVIDKAEVKPVTIKYVDSTGKEIHKKQVETGKLGESFDFSDEKYQPTIKGYILDKDQLPKNAKGKFSDQAQTITYVYKAETAPTTDTTTSSDSTSTTDTSATAESTTTDSTNAAGNIVDGNSTKKPGNPAAAGTHTTTRKLPKTGETITPSYLIAGIGMLILSSILLIFNRRKAK